MQSVEDTMHKVFETFGILEHVLSFAEVPDLVSATEVNCRWKQAGRSDVLWKAACGDTLFWRSSLSNEAIDRLSVRQIRELFEHFLLREENEMLQGCLEKAEMKSLLIAYRDSLKMQQFQDLWFGSYASSVLDSRRKVILRKELCNPHGFMMYFKILEEELWDQADLDELVPYEDHPGLMLYPHSVCFFEPDGNFGIDIMAHQNPPTHLQWRWDERGLVQVGPYPHLIIERLDNGRWKLENVHVVLMFQESEARNSE